MVEKLMEAITMVLFGVKGNDAWDLRLLQIEGLKVLWRNKQITDKDFDLLSDYVVDMWKVSQHV